MQQQQQQQHVKHLQQPETSCGTSRMRLTTSCKENAAAEAATAAC
jgi:hypothetical protein